MTYFYNEHADEFVESDGTGDGDINNKVTITRQVDGTMRYKIEIDEFGYCVAAMNRLIQRITPTFIFPLSSNGLYQVGDGLLHELE